MDPILVHHCSSKIPEDTLRAWEDTLSDHRKLPTWQQLDNVITKRIDILETISDMRRPTHNSTHKSQSFFLNELDHITNYLCKKCKGNHLLRQCEQFKALSVNDRIKFVF